jgi:protease-4
LGWNIHTKGKKMSEETQMWERKVLEKVALAAVTEQRLARRWRIFFRLIWLAITFFMVVMIAKWISVGGNKPNKSALANSYTANINLIGEIATTGNKGVLADHVIESLRNAFADPKAKGIILRMNSPGGTPVAAGLIYDEILALRKQHPKKPIYSVIDELCASGCYYVAAATDQIFVNRASMVGSIGVLMDGFGFTGAMEKFGIERRLITAGTNKGLLDPFSPLKTEQKQFVENMLEEIHQQFIAAVKAGRGNRLKVNDDTFSGLIWNGDAAIKMGLVDGVGTVDFVAKTLIRAPEIVEFTRKRYLSEILTEQVGTAAGESMRSLFETKIH